MLCSSFAIPADLVQDILPVDPSPALLEEALAIWSLGHDCQPPKGAGAVRQESWDDAGGHALTQDIEARKADG